MTQMATTASQAKIGLNSAALRIQAERARLTNILQEAETASANLTAMKAEYAPLITAINQAAAQFPTDEALKTYKAEGALLAAEFDSLLAKAQQIETAVTGITF